jgi:hypothetical protein
MQLATTGAIDAESKPTRGECVATATYQITCHVPQRAFRTAPAWQVVKLSAAFKRATQKTACDMAREQVAHEALLKAKRACRYRHGSILGWERAALDYYEGDNASARYDLSCQVPAAP